MEAGITASALAASELPLAVRVTVPHLLCRQRRWQGVPSGRAPAGKAQVSLASPMDTCFYHCLFARNAYLHGLLTSAGLFGVIGRPCVRSGVTVDCSTMCGQGSPWHAHDLSRVHDLSMVCIFLDALTYQASHKHQSGGTACWAGSLQQY
jgi:hypothetical protein